MSGFGPHVWNQGIARRTLSGGRTQNPTPAASALLGKRLVARAKSTLKRRGRKRAHRGNPVPAVVALLGPLLGGRFQSRDKRDAGRKATADALAERALLGDAQALAELEAAGMSFATQVAKTYALTRLAQVRAALVQRAKDEKAAGVAATAAQRAAAAAERRAGQAVTTERLGLISGAAGQIGAALTRAPKGLRAGSGLGRVAGRASSAAASVGGTVGAVGGASAAAVAGVVIGGLAVGAAIGTGLRLAFGTARAVRAEEAAVEANLQLRRVRADVEAQLGRKVTPADAKKMFQAAEAHLRDLGFVQQANGQWHRPRSAVERLLG